MPTSESAFGTTTSLEGLAASTERTDESHEWSPFQLANPDPSRQPRQRAVECGQGGESQAAAEGSRSDCKRQHSQAGPVCFDKLRELPLPSLSVRAASDEGFSAHHGGINLTISRGDKRKEPHKKDKKDSCLTRPFFLLLLPFKIMELDLTADQMAFIRQAIESGRFHSAEDALRFGRA